MAFDKVILKAFLKRRGLTQADLADMIGKDTRTIRRWLSPKEPLKPNAIEEICAALKVSPEQFDPDWSGPRETSKDVQIGARISPAAANGYALMRRRYGVSKRQLIELAPVMFAAIAERALTRGERMEQEDKRIRNVASALGLKTNEGIDRHLDFDRWDYLNRCKGAAEAGEVFGLKEQWDFSTNLLCDELAELVTEDQSNWVRNNGRPGECPDSCGYHFCKPLAEEIADGVPGLVDAIAEGHVELSRMDDHLWEPENKVERLRWLKHQANNFAVTKQKENAQFLGLLRAKHPALAEMYEEICFEQDTNVVPLERDGRRVQ